MICRFCRSGADLVQDARPHTVELSRAVGNDFHALCEGISRDKTWCDCQHAGTTSEVKKR